MRHCCFNPCFNGSIFQTWRVAHIRSYEAGFNPCFNGSIFQTFYRLFWHFLGSYVSILVLMEVSFRLLPLKQRSFTTVVSILVLMEVSFRLFGLKKVIILPFSFNPCFNGSIFQTSTNALFFENTAVFQSLF